jgi:hypothetical protein
MGVEGAQRGSGQSLGPEGVPAELMGEFILLSGQLETSLEPLAENTLQRLNQALPTSILDSDFAEQIGRFLRASLRLELRDFRNGALPDGCPEVDALAAREVAEKGELKWLLSGYRFAQMALWQAWFEAVEESIPDPESRTRLLRHGSDYFFHYAALLAEHVTDLYQRQLERSPGGGERRRFREIQALLAGEQIVDSGLELDLDRHHLGLIAWGEDPLDAARELAGELGRPLLAVCPLELGRTCWAWISGTRPLDPVEQRLLAQFQPTCGHIALGIEAFGEAGFRATHRQAIRARRFTSPDGPPIVRYSDLAVEALAAESEVDARAFVAHELRGIEDESQTSCRLRETLQAYFDSEYNAACAAAALGVHQQTIANRLRAAEERLGHHSIGARHLELELALRLRSHFARGPER